MCLKIFHKIRPHIKEILKDKNRYYIRKNFYNLDVILEDYKFLNYYISYVNYIKLSINYIEIKKFNKEY